ncbi:hypothetical protein BH10PSE17_BH10PSE17_11960 [soil metagenome]
MTMLAGAVRVACGADALPAVTDLSATNDDAIMSTSAVDLKQRSSVPGLAQLEFAPAASPSVRIAPKQGTWNWTAARELRVRLQNAMPWPITFIVTMRDSAGGQLRSVVGLPPGPPCTLIVPVEATDPRAFGMRAGPIRPYGSGNDCRQFATKTVGVLDRSRISAIELSMPAPVAAQTVLVGQLSLRSGDDDIRAAYAGLVDGWGQNTRARWPERVTSDADLRKRAQAEAESLLQSVPGPVLDRFGGIASNRTPPLTPTGFFRTERIIEDDGKPRWWLVTPAGHRFFSIGVNAVEAVNGATYVQGREWMFNGLPDERGPFAARWFNADSRRDIGAQRERNYGFGRGFDFYGANLQRLYGADYLPAWRERTARRLKHWGFNTVGNWSDDGFSAQHLLPYTQSISIAGDYATVSDGHDWWGRMPDPFDPRFEQAAQRAITDIARQRRNDPWLLGYFVDNELAWGNGGSADPKQRFALAYNTLRHSMDSPAKRVFVATLRQKYGDAAKLGQAWGLELRDWQTVESAGFDAPPATPERAAMSADLAAFQTAYADQYFGIVRKTLRAADPNHLYLGSRFAARTPESVASCARLCDVVSFNLYVTSLALGFETEAFAALDRPAIVGEFHFGSSDRGPLWGGVVEAESEAARGELYARFLDSVLAQPAFVGAHWFQYVDQPVTGRLLDGENGHFGLVGITDLPYAGFVDAARAKHREIVDRLDSMR